MSELYILRQIINQ